jgi:hypothetical protein
VKQFSRVLQPLLLSLLVDMCVSSQAAALLADHKRSSSLKLLCAFHTQLQGTANSTATAEQHAVFSARDSLPRAMQMPVFPFVSNSQSPTSAVRVSLALRVAYSVLQELSGAAWRACSHALQ